VFGRRQTDAYIEILDRLGVKDFARVAAGLAGKKLPPASKSSTVSGLIAKIQRPAAGALPRWIRAEQTITIRRFPQRFARGKCVDLFGGLNGA